MSFIYIPNTVPVGWGLVTAFGPVTSCIGPKINNTVHIGVKFLAADSVGFSPVTLPVGSVHPIFLVAPHNQSTAILGPTIAAPNADVLHVDLALAALVNSSWQETIGTGLAAYDVFGILFPIPNDPSVIGTRWDVQSARLDVPTNLLWMSTTDTFEVGF